MKTIRIACRAAENLTIDDFEPFQGQLKSLSEENYKSLKGEIVETGFAFPIHIWKGFQGENYIIGGHQRLRALQEMRKEGYEIPAIPVVYVEADDFNQAKRRVLQDVSQYGKVERQGLYEFMTESEISFEDLKKSFDIPAFSLDLESFKVEFFDLNQPAGSGLGEGNEEGGKTLSERFLVPPFSVLDARQGYWQTRKAQWLNMGIQSEMGRKGNLLGMSNTVLEPDPEKRKKMLTGEGYKGGNAMSGAGTSIFDPVLCEVVYRWFSPKGGVVLDPFAGGSVRGITASKLGRQYIGVELREEQVKANQEQGLLICSDPIPVWKCGDSVEIQRHCEGVEADLVFSCPPYADLEVYSDDPKDLSTMAYDDFMNNYREIIHSSLSLLKPDRFACFVVGEVREKNKQGFYKNFVLDTIQAFEDGGARFYNEAILLTPLGTLPIRTAKMFSAGRKLGKTHQNILIFCKGDPRVAADYCGEVIIEDLEEKLDLEHGQSLPE